MKLRIKIIFFIMLFGAPVRCKLPIIYHQDYNINIDRLFGIDPDSVCAILDTRIPDLPFDTVKYRKIVDFLKSYGIDDRNFFEPVPVTDGDLMLVHTLEYIFSLANPDYLGRLLELPQLVNARHKNIKEYFLNPIYLAAGGTVLGCELALQNGWAINLSGGYHHAKTTSGGGFCVISDIAIAIKKYWQTKPGAKILIVDLDAHQGTGYSEIFLRDSNVFIFDVYNQDRLSVRSDIAQDIALRFRINFNYPVNSGISDQDYLKILTGNLPAAISSCDPDLIIYVAGSDVFCGDPAGAMQISQAGIIQRDEYVFALAEQFKKPILMLLAGGYTNQSAEICGRSILNILRKKNCLSYYSWAASFCSVM